MTSSRLSAATRFSRQMATGLPSTRVRPAGRLARPIAGAPEDSRKDVGLPIEQVGVREPSLRDEADVLRHVRVRGTRPLTVHHAVVVVGVANVGRLHQGVIIGHPAKRLGTDDL